jgi:hypothetical protein
MSPEGSSRPGGRDLKLFWRSLPPYRLPQALGSTSGEPTGGPTSTKSTTVTKSFRPESDTDVAYDIDTHSFLAVNTAAVTEYGYPPAVFLALTRRDAYGRSMISNEAPRAARQV